MGKSVPSARRAGRRVSHTGGREQMPNLERGHGAAPLDVDVPDEDVVLQPDDQVYVPQRLINM